MTFKNQLCLISAAVLSALLMGCGDAETTIVEKDPITDGGSGDGTGNGGGGNSGDIIIESVGRLAVLSQDGSGASFIDLDDGSLLDEFTFNHEGSRVVASPDYRYLTVSARTEGVVQFIDGGLWREDHVAHLHDYEQAPAWSDYSLQGSRPTHIDPYSGQMTIFYDGDSEAGLPAGVQVVTDNDIAKETEHLPELAYNTNMHGVAKARGDMLISVIRRDDAETTSGNGILPDQVGAFHLHGEEYELEKTFEHLCPDLHGAAQNEHNVVFGCSDGVLVVHEHDGEYESHKIANIDALGDLRIGSVYGHQESELFLGVASSRSTGQLVLTSIAAEAKEMEQLAWEGDATPVSYSFAYGGTKLLILDNQGYLSSYEVHAHDGHMEFEFETKLDISEEDVTQMPEGLNFSMTVAQNGDSVFVADPIAQHVLHIDTGEMTVSGDFELSFSPSNVVWLGIKEAAEGHSH